MLNTTLYSIDEEKGLVSTDKADEVFKLDIAGVTLDSDGKVATTAVDGTIDVVDVGTATSKWDNYNVSVYAGEAKVISANAIVLDDNKDLTTGMPNNTENADIMFTKRTLNVENWNVLVLPFEVSVAKLSEAFGYAVVDVLDQTANDGDVHFKLKVSGEIAANTPFLIYPSDANNNLNQVVFTGVYYEKIASATAEVADAAGNKFIGVYKNTDVENPDWYMAAGTWYSPETGKKATIKPLRAYVKFAPGAGVRSIFVEEPDGTDTVITTDGVTSISADEKSNTVEGIYNLNGVRVNKAQKGIYIINGKKVVK